MSVLIKGINTSKDCWKCKFRRWENGYGDQCIITDTFIKDIFIKEKDCPLVEIPPHGRLIDADELWKDITTNIEDCAYILGQIMKQSTIIGEERSEE